MQWSRCYFECTCACSHLWCYAQHRTIGLCLRYAIARSVILPQAFGDLFLIDGGCSLGLTVGATGALTELIRPVASAIDAAILEVRSPRVVAERSH